MTRLAWLLFVGLAALFLGPAIVGDGTVYFGDIFFFEQPRDHFLAATIHSGEGIPRWIPGVWGGAPALGAQEMALLYPPTLILALVAPGSAPAIGLALHLVLAAFGARALARRLDLGPLPALLVAVTYVFGGALLSTHVIPVYVRSAAWLPWLLTGVLGVSRGERRGLALATLALVGTYLGGDPLGCAVGALGALLASLVAPPARGLATGWSHFPRAVVGLLVSSVAAVLVSAAQLLPGLAALGESARQGGIGFDFAGRWSLWPAEILGLAVPFVFGSLADPKSVWFQAVVPDSPVPPIHDRSWAEAYYLGPIALALAAAGLSRAPRSSAARAGVALLAVFTFLALGRFNPAYRWIFEHVPAFSIFRFPAKLFVPAILGVALLAGSGLRELMARDRRAAVSAAGTLVVLGLAALVGAVVVGLRADDLGARIDACGVKWVAGKAAMEALAPRLAHVFVFAAGGLAIVLAGRVKRPGRVAGTLLALVVLDLAIALRPAVFLAPREGLARAPRVASVLATLARDETPARTITTAEALKPTLEEKALFPENAQFDHFFFAFTEALKPNLALTHGLLSQQGFLSSAPLRAARLENLRGIPLARIAVLRGARFLIASDKEVSLLRGEARPLAVMGPRVLLELEKAPPWAGLYTRVRAASDMKGAIAAIASPSFDPAREVVLETGLALTPVDEDVVPAAIHGRFGLHRFEVDVAPVRPSWLVVRETYARGWSATVDGVPAVVVPADGLFRAVAVSPGARRVVFTYEAPHGTLGALVSALALAACAVAGVRGRSQGNGAAPKGTVPSGAAFVSSEEG